MSKCKIDFEDSIPLATIPELKWNGNFNTDKPFTSRIHAKTSMAEYIEFGIDVELFHNHIKTPIKSHMLFIIHPKNGFVWPCELHTPGLSLTKAPKALIKYVMHSFKYAFETVVNFNKYYDEKRTYKDMPVSDAYKIMRLACSLIAAWCISRYQGIDDDTIENIITPKVIELIHDHFGFDDDTSYDNSTTDLLENLAVSCGYSSGSEE